MATACANYPRNPQLANFRNLGACSVKGRYQGAKLEHKRVHLCTSSSAHWHLMRANSQVPSLCWGRAQGLWSVDQEEFCPMTPAVSLSIFWAWVNCRVLNWITLVTLKPFFCKRRKWIWSSHPNQQESCTHCRSHPAWGQQLLQARNKAHTHTLSRGSLLSLPAYIWWPRISPSLVYLSTSKHHQFMRRDWILTDSQGNSIWRLYRSNCFKPASYSPGMWNLYHHHSPFPISIYHTEVLWKDCICSVADQNFTLPSSRTCTFKEHHHAGWKHRS